MKAAATTQRTARDIAYDINTRALEHGSVAKMLRAIFIECADKTQPSADRDREWPNELFEGLAVLEQYIERDSTQITDLVDELHRQLDAEVMSGRDEPGLPSMAVRVRHAIADVGPRGTLKDRLARGRNKGGA